MIQHTTTSQAAAFDATFSDTLPLSLSSPAVVSAVDSAGNPVTGFSVSGITVSNSDYDLPLGDHITLTVSAVVNDTASASSTIVNTADISWDTLGDNTQGNQASESGGTASDNAQFVVASPTFAKSIVSTGIDDATNDNTEVVAGEYVTYALTVTVPEGTTLMAQITDTLDTDLLFDSSFTITAVGSAGVTFSGTPTTPAVSGSDVTFDLGTIVNTKTDDGIADTVTITYRVYADSDVTLSDSLPNNATLIWDGDNDGDNTDPEDGSLSDDTAVTVIVPELQVAKRVSVVPGDAGDTVEYEMVISHTGMSNATAYDATFSDPVPAGISGVTVVSAVDSGGAPVAGFTATGNLVENASFDLPVGETITVTVSGTATNSITEGDTVTNTSTITWGTLDAANDDGIEAGEATDTANDSSSFSLSDVRKTIVSTGIDDASNDNSEVVTGEYITYQLEIDVPHGVSELAEIEDVLDAGLVYDSATAVTVTPSSGNLSTSLAPGDFSTVAASVDAPGNTVSFELGDIINTAPAGTVETLTITYRVYVANDAVNAGVGDTLNNAVDFKWDIDRDGSNDGLLDGSTEANAPDVTVIAPELEIVKSITSTPSDAGDTIVYEFVIQHTGASQAGAFDATFSDVLPSELSSVSVVSAVDSSNNPVSGFGVSGNTVSNSDYDLPLGETITLTVGATVNTTASSSTTVDNTANIDWDTLGDDSQGNQTVEDGGSASDDAEFVVASPTFAKSIVSTGIDDASNDNTEVVAGEFVTYALTVTVPEGTTPMAQITDTLDADLLFDNSYTVTAVGSSGVTFSGTPTTPAVSGSDVTFDLGTIVNTNIDDGVADTVTITYRVHADSDVVLADSLPNNATFIWDGDNDGDNTDPEDGSLNDSAAVSVIAPELQIAKQVSLMPSDAGDAVEYEMVISHTGTSGAAAYDVAFSDAVPAGITDVAVVSTIDNAGTRYPVSLSAVIWSSMQALIWRLVRRLR